MKDNRTPDDRQELTRETKGKKPYRKPAFRYERVFETAALTCGKIYSVQQTCVTSRKVS